MEGNNKMRGFTLIEILIYVVIVSGIILVAVSFGSLFCIPV